MKADLIYDVGFNTGQDTMYYLAKGYRVVAIDADPALCKQGQRKFAADIVAGRLILLNVAIAEENGSVPFWVNKQFPGWSSLSEELGSRKYGADCINIAAARFASILHSYGVPYYLKIDIEGYDLLCVEALGELGEKPKFVSAEAVDACLPALHRLGYKRFQLREQMGAHNLDLSECPWHRWPPDSSGPFGPYLSDRWVSYDEALAQRHEFLAGDPSVTFYDIHAAWGEH